MKDIKSVSLVDRRGYLTVALEIGALTPQQFTTSTISNYHWYFVRHCRERKYADDSTCISFFRWWDGRAGAAEAGGSPWLVQPRAEAGQCDTSVTQVWHKCDTSVTSYYVDVSGEGGEGPGDAEHGAVLGQEGRGGGRPAGAQHRGVAGIDIYTRISTRISTHRYLHT